jgi:L,D-transpeptidase YcbB
MHLRVPIALCANYSTSVNPLLNSPSAGTGFANTQYLYRILTVMRLNICYLALLLLAVYSCQPASQKNGSSSSSSLPSAVVEQKITERNTRIEPSNAYNNFFLDTSAVEKFIKAQHMDDTLANRLRSFYNARNFEYAWFDQYGLNEQAYGFRSLYDYSVDTSENNKSLEYRLNALMNGDIDSLGSTDPNIVKTELQLTQRFIIYFLHAHHDDKDVIDEMEAYVPAEKKPLKEAVAAALKANPNASLATPLKKYTDLMDKPWDTITVTKKKLKVGDSDPVIAQIKHRLNVTGELQTNDTTNQFTDTLANAVMTFETSRGHTPRAVITDTLIREMNESPAMLAQRILINMERMRWLPPTPEGRLITVNIPEFMLHAHNGKQKDFDMAVVVGKEGKSTTMFSGMLNQVVFSPYWNLPRSIIKEEVMPHMAKNKNYLASKHMEVTGTSDGVPVIRQVPGKDNPLGRVKFLFPNSFNIYFHDTNEKQLFNRDQRAYSHGCIRLADPVKMANYVLSGNKEWTSEKIDSAMNSGKEKYVRVKDPVPVLITYYTAWADDQGVLHFREDIYGHDQEVAEKLFTAAK